MKKTILILVLALSMLLTGCGGTREREQEEVNNEIDVVQNIEDLEDNAFYVQKETGFERLYVKNSNYDISKSTSKSQDDSHTLWYKDDWNKIPTMYAGDKLVYKTSDTLDEHFWLERFEYVGYTVGISGLERTDSGRYSFSTDQEKMNIYTGSNAKDLYNLPTEMCIIDRIGGGDLRDGNVSSGGCILGLEKDKTYLAEIYAGTYLNNFKLTADNIALTSMEFYETVQYSFMQSQILEIHFPEYFNSGYYMLNNFGVVRYVNGPSYDETTDFNIPNEIPEDEEVIGQTEEGEGETGYNEGDLEPATTTITEKIDISKAGSYTITLTYNPDGSGSRPSAIIYNDDVAYQLRAQESGRLVRTEVLQPGTYTLEITGMGSMKYGYDIKANGSFEAEDSNKAPDEQPTGEQGGQEDEG